MADESQRIRPAPHQGEGLAVAVLGEVDHHWRAQGVGGKGAQQ